MNRTAICPNCHSEVEEDYDGEYECHKCGCVFTEDGEIIVAGE